MDLINRLRESIDREGNIAIVVSQNHGIDEMGAALSFYLSLKASNKNVSIISLKEPLVEVSNLVGIDKVKPAYQGQGGDLIVAFPYQEGEIEKISYTLENGSLNIVVKPSGETLSFGEKDVQFRNSGGLPGTIITFGIKRISEISKIFDIESLKETTLVNFDRGEGNEGFGNIVFSSPNASSISEEVSNVLLSMSSPMDLDISQNLLSGLISATSNFQNPRTSSLAFEMAGVLMRNGARRKSGGENRPNAPQFGPNNQGGRPQQQQFPPRRDFKKERSDKNPPEDWLTPKIYKGSQNVS